MIKVITILAILTLTGCGKVDRFVAGWTGDASETCHGNVMYLQFTSGASVKYNTDGTVAKCHNK